MTEEHCKNCEALSKALAEAKHYLHEAHPCHWGSDKCELCAWLVGIHRHADCVSSELGCRYGDLNDQAVGFLQQIEDLRAEVARLNNLPLVQEIEERYAQIDELQAEIRRLKAAQLPQD